MTDETSSEGPREDSTPLHTTHESITDFASQDWLLVVEALATTAGPPETGANSRGANGTITRPRAARAWELVSAIVAEIDLPPGEIAFQIDDDWRGPSGDQ